MFRQQNSLPTGKANKCSNPECKIKNPKSYDWANISGKYKRDLNDFMMLCRNCHRAFDTARPIWNKVILQEITELVGEDDTIATIPADGFAQYEEEYRKAYAQQRYEILTKAKERYE